MKIERAWLLAALVAAIGLHAVPFLTYISRDLDEAYRGWFNQLAESGFSKPMGNYSPPFLYLLWCLTWLKGLIWTNALIKFLAVAGGILVAYSASRILKALGKPPEIGFFFLLLPSIILNTSLLGQSDTFWVAPCLLATAAAIEGKHGRVSAWAGLAFAFKGQAAVFAPFVVLLFAKARVRPLVWLIAPAVFLAAMVPAWLGGWTASYIASIYLGQAEYVDTAGDYFVGNGASLWTLLGFLAPKTVFELRWIGLPLVLVGLAAYWRYSPAPNARNMVRLAAISAAGVPFLLPLMLDRFFILAAVLAVINAIAFPSRRTILAAAAMEIASAWPIAVWAFFPHPWSAIGAPFALIALVLLWREPREASANAFVAKRANTSPTFGT
jgi:Gpi18-like mannosyltransferase